MSIIYCAYTSFRPKIYAGLTVHRKSVTNLKLFVKKLIVVKIMKFKSINGLLLTNIWPFTMVLGNGT